MKTKVKKSSLALLLFSTVQKYLSFFCASLIYFLIENEIKWVIVPYKNLLRPDEIEKKKAAGEKILYDENRNPYVIQYRTPGGTYKPSSGDQNEHDTQTREAMEETGLKIVSYDLKPVYSYKVQDQKYADKKHTKSWFLVDDTQGHLSVFDGLNPIDKETYAPELWNTKDCMTNVYKGHLSGFKSGLGRLIIQKEKGKYKNKPELEEQIDILKNTYLRDLYNDRRLPFRVELDELMAEDRMLAMSICHLLD